MIRNDTLNSDEHLAVVAVTRILMFIGLVIAISLAPTFSPAQAAMDQITSEAKAAISNCLKDQLPPSYQIIKTKNEYHFHNPNHTLEMTASSQGVCFSGSQGKWDWGLRMLTVGDENMTAPLVSSIEANGTYLALHRSTALTEWYHNTIFGIEQGFTLHQRPANNRDDRIRLVLAMEGSLTPVLVDNTHLVLQDHRGIERLRYAGLYVTDASGRSLPAELGVTDHLLIISVDDRDAVYPITIDPWVEQIKVIAADGATYDSFGFCVEAGNNLVAVGAPRHDDPASPSYGAVYLFEPAGGGWRQAAKLTASEGSKNGSYGGSYLGGSIAISGDVVAARIVSYSADHFMGGAIYLFEKPAAGWSNMTETTQLKPSDSGNLAEFGHCVAENGNRMVIGAPMGEYSGTDSFYIFGTLGSGWTQSAKLTASDLGFKDRFGHSVAASGDTIVVGAPQQDIGGNIDQGSAYVFEFILGFWSQTAKLTASDGAANDWFGRSVAILGDYIAVGASYDDIGTNTNQGSVYLFQKPAAGWSNMTQTAKLTASDGAANDELGYPVGINADTVIAGASEHDTGGNSNRGAAYLFQKPAAGWSNMTETAKLTASDGAAEDMFGSYVSIYDQLIVVGAPYDDIGTNDAQGSAYLFVPSSTLPPIYRFYSDALKKHFYTADSYEKDWIIANFPPEIWNYEGVAYRAALNEGSGRLPVFRFYSEAIQSHFYTIDQYEKDWIIANFPENVWRYEGVAWYVFNYQAAGTMPVYRFYSEAILAHLYTMDAYEKDWIIANFPENVWRYEGIAYYTYPGP